MRFSIVFQCFVGVAGLTIFLGSGCGDSGTNGSVGTGGSIASGGAPGGQAGGVAGRSGSGGSTTAGSGGDAGGGLGGIWGNVALGGAGGSWGADGGLDGAGGESRVDAACIDLADIPTVQISAADSSVQIWSLVIISGPCTSNSTMSVVEFFYWEKGYSCPRGGDTVTCQVEVTSSLGSVAVVTVEFIAGGGSSWVFTWQPQQQPMVRFPSLDGAVAE